MANDQTLGTPGPIPGNQSWTLPRVATLYQYDLRGNLSQDAHWLYTWDAENRLVVQEQKYPGTATDGAREVKRLEFSYDSMGRRISKKLLVSQKLSNGQLVGAWSFSKETVFIWQDWVLLAEFVKTSSGGNFELRRSYLWGLDVDGRLGGAGGVGGLLWVADYVPGQATSNRQLAPWYDGNGNVMGWMENDGVPPLPQHRLEYDPYGKLLVDDTVRPTRNKKQRDLGVSEEWLDRPAFAFSTKYEDAETGLLYYGYRYYAPEIGRWINRDPIEEKGGNIYKFDPNSPISGYDYLGGSWMEQEMARQLKESFDAVGDEIERKIDEATNGVKDALEYVLERFKNESQYKYKKTFRLRREVIDTAHVSFWIGGDVSVSTDGCCVTVSGSPVASLTFKALRFWGVLQGVGGVSGNVSTSWTYCHPTNTSTWKDLNLGMGGKIGIRGSLPIPKDLPDLKSAFVEGGVYTKLDVDLLKGWTSSMTQAGMQRLH